MIETRRETAAALAAADLMLLCVAIEDLGAADLASRARLVATELRWALAELQSERSARQAIQERAERLQAIIGRGAYEALERAA